MVEFSRRNFKDGILFHANITSNVKLRRKKNDWKEAKRWNLVKEQTKTNRLHIFF